MIDIGKVIYKRLDDNNIVCYPIVAPENSPLPVVVYERNFNYNLTKDGRSNGGSNIDIYVVTDDYKDGITLAKTIDEIMINTNGSILGINIYDVNLVSGGELFADSMYIQKITYNIKAR